MCDVVRDVVYMAVMCDAEDKTSREKRAKSKGILIINNVTSSNVSIITNSGYLILSLMCPLYRTKALLSLNLFDELASLLELFPLDVLI